MENSTAGSPGVITPFNRKRTPMVYCSNIEAFPTIFRQLARRRCSGRPNAGALHLGDIEA